MLQTAKGLQVSFHAGRKSSSVRSPAEENMQPLGSLSKDDTVGAGIEVAEMRQSIRSCSCVWMQRQWKVCNSSLICKSTEF